MKFSTSVKTSSDYNSFLDQLALPKINLELKNLCESDLSENELYNSMKSMQENKSPGNDGLSKEFYETFWDEIKKPFMKSLCEAKIKSTLSISQRQAVIKLLQKKDVDKRFIQNWRPISLLSVDLKIISKAFAKRLKETLPMLISTQQTAYVQNRNISEVGRLISDIIEICDKHNIDGYLVTMDIKKAFDYLEHSFLIAVLEKFNFGENFIDWIKILLKNQESYVLNGGKTTSYFNLEKGACQGDPISPYLFILALEVLFVMIKNKESIKGIEIFEHLFLYTAFADD